MLNYERLSDAVALRIENDKKCGSLPSHGFCESDVIRRVPSDKDRANVWRTAFIRDIDKIMHCP